jgi:hypothetical protein
MQGGRSTTCSKAEATPGVPWNSCGAPPSRSTTSASSSARSAVRATSSAGAPLLSERTVA